VFGLQDSALPLIRSDLGLSYTAIGLLLSFPAFTANLIEMPIGLAADGPRRRRLVIAGGGLFTGALLAVSAAPTFVVLLLALTVLYPASGAFVFLSQADLMDTDPDRREQNMARWNLAGSIGALAGPGLLTAAVFAGPGWRGAYAVTAIVSAAALASRAFAPAPTSGHREPGPGFRQALVAALRSLVRPEVVRTVALLEASDLMLDVLTGYLALYFVDVLRQPPWFGALVVGVRVGAGLAGDVISVQVLERMSGTTYVRLTAIATAGAYAALLLVPNVAAKIALIATLSVLTSGWYPVLQARLFQSLPGQSGALLAIGNVFRMITTPLALVIGLAAARIGLGAALWILLASPVLLVLLLRRPRSGDGVVAERQDVQGA
jgi:MFS transporter, FSR family, fosmidomycin resistance protein